VTLHRPSNVDDAAELHRLMGFPRLGLPVTPVVYPVHPRARRGMASLGADGGDRTGLRLIDPVGYVDFLRLMSMARLVVTDSGGVQEETSVLGVPCVTLRTSTERPVTIAEGTNHLVSPDDLDLARRVVREILDEETTMLRADRRYGTVTPGCASWRLSRSGLRAQRRRRPRRS